MNFFAEQGSASQKFFLVVYLIKKTPVEELVQKLKAGKSISKNKYCGRVSPLFRQSFTYLTFDSEEQSTRSRYCGNINNNVSEVSVIDAENRCAMSIYKLQA